VVPHDTEQALSLLTDRPLVVLGGAGVSTDSGIPDYRGPDSTARLPMTYQDFRSGPESRQRYWARSHLGWSRMKRAEPNAGHQAIARLGANLVITQNVDGLHERVGTSPLVALHGRIAEVICLDCGQVSDRAALTSRMNDLNPDWAARHAHVASLPDGDVDLAQTAGFVVPPCLACAGVLKPHVVFFGENVPKPRVQRCFDAVDALAAADPRHAGAVLVLGSSLTVMSGLRFVRRAAKSGTPVVIVNRGTTRGDDLATLRLHVGTSEFATLLAEHRAPRTPRTLDRWS